MNTSSPFLSVVVPAFDESGRIREPLQRIDAYLGAQDYTSELIVVDDGSTDATCELVCETAAGLATLVRVVRYEANRGFATDPDQASEVFVVGMGVTREPSASPAR